MVASVVVFSPSGNAPEGARALEFQPVAQLFDGAEKRGSDETMGDSC